MASPSPILSADRGRAMATALLFLCLLASVEVILVVRAVSQAKVDASSEKTPSPVPAASVSLPMPALSAPTRISPPPVGQLAAIAEPAVPAVPPTASGFGPPPIGSFQAPSISAASAPAPQAAPPVPSPPAPTPRPLPSAPPVATRSLPPGVPSQSADPAASMTLMEMVDLAKQVRSLGDMQGALEVLKRADLQFPGAPEVAVETALCYEQMGLKDKAVGLWKQIEGSTSAKSAGFADLAKRKLGQSATSAGEPLAFSGSFGPKLLSLGACQAQRDPGTANGEKVVLRIPILRQGNAPVDPAQVDINVYFFDRVNGEKIAQTIADEPLSTWGAPPVDWTGLGEEPLEVTYFLPTLTPGEITAHGRRSYHGYVVRLYYQDKLQDEAAEPRDLLDFGSREPQTLPGGGANPLLPPVAN